MFLHAMYEATLAVAAIHAAQQGQRIKVFLTCVGGGAFGNRSAWIVKGLERALDLYKEEPLDIYLVHYMRVPKGDFSSMEKHYKKPPKL